MGDGEGAKKEEGAKEEEEGREGVSLLSILLIIFDCLVEDD